MYSPRLDGLIISLSAFHAVGRGFVSWLGHKDRHKNVTNCLPAWQAMR